MHFERRDGFIVWPRSNSVYRPGHSPPFLPLSCRMADAYREKISAYPVCPLCGCIGRPGGLHAYPTLSMFDLHFHSPILIVMIAFHEKGCAMNPEMGKHHVLTFPLFKCSKQRCANRQLSSSFLSSFPFHSIYRVILVV